MIAFQTVAAAPLGVALRFGAMLLMLGQLFLLALTLGRQKRRAALPAALHLLLGFFALTLLLDGSYRLEYLPYARGWLPAVQALYRLPWLLIAGAELADALALGLGFRRQVRLSRRQPSVQTVKEAVDLLPAGVCICEPEGTVLLSNLRMNEWYRHLTGLPLTDGNALRRSLEERGRPQEGKRLLFPEDGTALLFSETALELAGRCYVQFTAEDVTERYRVTRELEEKNARLRDLQYRMKSYRVRESELLMRQELLAARTVVHNQLGGALLTGKYHLEHPESTDPETLRLMLWQLNTYLLAEVEDPEPRGDELDDALRLAAGIGVAVTLRGEVPPAGQRRTLLGLAVAECAANTVKHAGGDRLEVLSEKDRFRILGSGMPPSGPVVPAGGLRSLQLAVEGAGGRLELESSPVFTLTITLPQPGRDTCEA